MACGCITTLSLFLVDNKNNVYLQKGIIGYGWLTTEETSFTNTSNIFLDIDNSFLYTKCNLCSITDLGIIEITFYNDSINEWNEISKLYSYGWFILKFIGSEEKI